MAEQPEIHIIDRVAVGGMADVFLARQGDLHLALKKTRRQHRRDPRISALLAQEARIGAMLRHRNIVEFFGSGEHDGQTFITMEFVDGANLLTILRALTRRGVSLPVGTAVHVATELCHALDHAHNARDRDRHGVVHHDISPQNVLVSCKGQVKLCDFGIAKPANRAHGGGRIRGKYAYMSPEQARGECVGLRSDLFSLGIVLYELLVGRMLYSEQDTERLLAQVRAARIAPPRQQRPDIPEALENIVLTALAPRAEDRWPSAQALGAALRSFRDHGVSNPNASLAACVALATSPRLPAGARRMTRACYRDGAPVVRVCDRAWDEPTDTVPMVASPATPDPSCAAPDGTTAHVLLTH